MASIDLDGTVYAVSAFYLCAKKLKVCDRVIVIVIVIVIIRGTGRTIRKQRFLASHVLGFGAAYRSR